MCCGITDLKHDYILTEDFVKNHFLVGLLLTEVKSALNEIQDIRKFAITTLRNLLAKHSVDDRYSSKVCIITVNYELNCSRAKCIDYCILEDVLPENSPSQHHQSSEADLLNLML